MQAENERLTEEKDKYQTKWQTAYMNELDLQKQVDELEKWLGMKEHRIGMLENNLKQAVKDTAKEILQRTIQLSDVCESFYEFQNRLIDLIEVNYGIEVETKTIIPEKDHYGVEVE